MLRDLMVFGRILISGRAVRRLQHEDGRRQAVAALVQQINRVHHQDEARHIAFGRQMMRALCERAAATAGEDGLRVAGDYLARYTSVCLQSFYSPAVYTDAGIEGGRRLRARLLEDPVREQAHRDLMSKTTTFLERLGLAPAAAIAVAQ